MGRADFFHQGAPGWSYFVATSALADFRAEGFALLAFALVAVRAVGAFAGRFFALVFGFCFFAM